MDGVDEWVDGWINVWMMGMTDWQWLGKQVC
jgi:hypothetical protein